MFELHKLLRQGLKKSIRQGIKGGGLVAVLAGLSACSVFKVGYNNAPALAHTWLVTRIDLYDDQSQLAKAALNQLFDWHRKNELPVFQRQFQSIADRPSGLQSVTESEIAQLSDAVRLSLHRSAEYAAPLLANVLLSLWPNQIEPVQTLLDQSNEDYKDKYLNGTAKESRQAQVDSLTERFETWLGPLTDSQIKLIETRAPPQSDQRFDNRLARQARFMELVTKAANRQIDQASLSKQLEVFLNEWQRPKNPQERAVSEARRVQMVRLVKEVLSVSTTEQEDNLRGKARDWAEVLGELINES